MVFSTICVFCGSQTTGSTFYMEQTQVFAELLVGHKLELVYGGTDMGLMGTIASTMKALGGSITGIVPELFVNSNTQNIGLNKLIVTESISERKKLMIELSDVFIVLPGGVGTLDELFEIWTNLQLNLHNKPIGILNFGGYFDHLIAFIDNATELGFISEEHRSQLIISQTAKELFDLLKIYSINQTSSYES